MSSTASREVASSFPKYYVTILGPDLLSAPGHRDREFLTPSGFVGCWRVTGDRGRQARTPHQRPLPHSRTDQPLVQRDNVDQFRANKCGYCLAKNRPDQCESTRQSDQTHNRVQRRILSPRSYKYVVKRWCSQCIRWVCPAIGKRESAANASRHAPSTASTAKAEEGRRW